MNFRKIFSFSPLHFFLFCFLINFTSGNYSIDASEDLANSDLNQEDINKKQLTKEFIFSPNQQAKQQITTHIFEVSSKIAIINIEKIINNLDSFNIFRDRLQKISKDIQQDMIMLEKNLKQEEAELIKQRGKIDEIEFTNQVKKFNQKVNDTQKNIQQKKLKIEKIYNKALVFINKKIIEIIENLASSDKYDIILESGYLLYYKSSFDITDHVIFELNKLNHDININSETLKIEIKE